MRGSRALRLLMGGLGLLGVVTFVGMANVAGATVVKVATVSVGTDPDGLSVSGTYLWVAIETQAEVQKIDLATTTPTVVATIAVGTTPIGTYVNGTHVWVLNVGSNSIMKITAKTDALDATFTLTARPRAMIILSGYLWVLVGGTLRKLTQTTGTVKESITLGASPVGLVYSDTFIWVADEGDNLVWKVNPTTDVATNFITGHHSDAIAASATFIWLSNSSVTKIEQINATTNLGVATIPVGNTPSNIVVVGDYVYVSNYTSTNVSVVTITSQSVVATITTGKGANGLATDGTYVWVSNSTSNTVSEIGEPYQAPTPPRNVTASAGDSQVVVSWTAPLSTGGKTITGYKVALFLSMNSPCGQF